MFFSDNREEEPERISGCLDELSHVGLPQHLNVQSVFESGKNTDLTLVSTYVRYLSAHNGRCTHECTVCCIFRAMLGT